MEYWSNEEQDRTGRAKPDSAKPTSRPARRFHQTEELGRAKAQRRRQSGKSAFRIWAGCRTVSLGPACASPCIGSPTFFRYRSQMRVARPAHWSALVCSLGRTLKVATIRQMTRWAKAHSPASRPCSRSARLAGLVSPYPSLQYSITP
jgi:hypothetical protein